MADFHVTERAIDAKIAAAINNSGGVKEYEALLTQSGTSAPTVTVLKNTLGGEPVYSYQDVGHFRANLNGAFPEGKTSILMGGLGTSGFLMYSRGTDNFIQIFTLNASNTAANDRLFGTTIKIKVYP